MKKITIVCGTNRRNSYSEKVAMYYAGLLTGSGHEVKVLNMQEYENITTLSGYFDKVNEKRDVMIADYIVPAQGFIFIVPEYNGSMPGILKLFLDTIHPKFWENKHACITGIASGRAGNLRGMDHLTGILNYLKVHVFHNKLPISMVDKIFAEGSPSNEETAKVIQKQLEGFLTVIP